MSDITLSAGVRQNLLSLQNTAQLMATTENRLATGKKVNSALDNPLNFFTSQSLNAQANDLSNLLDAMANGIQTIQAANNGITSITSLVQQLQSTVSQARADSTTPAVTAGTATDVAANNSTNGKTTLRFVIGGNNVDISTGTDVPAVPSTLTGTGADFTNDETGSTLTIQSGSGAAVSITMTSFDGTESAQDVVDQINTDLSNASSTISASLEGGQIKLTDSSGEQITVGGTAAADFGFGAGNTQSSDGSPADVTNDSLSAIVTAINSNASLAGKVKASIDSTTNHLLIQNLTTTAITVNGISGGNITGDVSDSATLAAGTQNTLSSVRQNLLNQFNNLLTQIDGVAKDSGFNGVNLLNGDKLTVKFNADGSSSIDVQATDSSGNAFAINSTNLGINTQADTDFASNTSLDAMSTTLNDALTTLRTQASSLGSQLSIVQTRQDFTKNMINTLQVGADNLVLADTNEESANLLALQTRQSLSTTALSLSAQADQSVLRLFG
ncbi:MAG TPA: flagellin [Pseudolabrys sp.]|jgi:flagellin-like hook-associated protein FlgL|nr:flagellin [Pseudolabrys sp.]